LYGGGVIVDLIASLKYSADNYVKVMNQYLSG